MDKAELRAVRRRLGMSQKQLGALIGYTQQAISLMECGGQRVAPHLAKRVTALVAAHKENTSSAA